MNVLTARPIERSAAAFDGVAAGYDVDFTHTAVGRLMREAVWRRLDARFRPGDCVLDLGCGTGEDAVHLASRGVRVLAIDAAAAMVEAAKAKAAWAGVESSIEVRQAPIQELGALGADGQFDGAVSNFGALNCVADLRAAGRSLTALVRPGGTVLLCVMGPFVPWEWLWFLLRANPRRAFRRLRPGGAHWRGMTVRYPTPRAVCRALRPAFRPLRLAAIGALMPPSYAAAWAASPTGARILHALNQWERRWETATPLPWLADHYLLELQRTERGAA